MLLLPAFLSLLPACSVNCEILNFPNQGWKIQCAVCDENNESQAIASKQAHVVLPILLRLAMQAPGFFLLLLLGTKLWQAAI